MSHEWANIEVSNLLLDLKNPRLPNEASSQPEVAVALTKVIGGRQLLSLADHIVTHGISPLDPMCVIPTGDDAKRYVVFEGNRRLLALKALETPAIVASALTQREQKSLARLSAAYQKNPIETVRCVIMSTFEEAVVWVELRHAGPAGGSGIAGWGADEKERFKTRFKNERRTDVGQVIDFLEREGLLKRMGEAGPTKFQSNLKRLISTPSVRAALGLEKVDGVIYANYPKEELAKTLGYVAELFTSGKKSVKDIYHAEDRVKFVDNLPSDKKPDPSTRLSAPVTLENLSAGKSPKPAPPAPPRPARPPKKEKRPRTTVIPREVSWDIDSPRVNQIYIELKTLDATQFPNAAAVLLRVFLELSSDVLLSKLCSEDEKVWNNWTLAKKVKESARLLCESGKIRAQLQAEIVRMADKDKRMGGELMTLHQYVHNDFTLPSPSELFLFWDSLEPFLTAFWE